MRRMGIVRETRRYFYKAELYRLRGTLTLQIDGPAAEDEAEANIRQTLEIAGRQKARVLELRAAICLCRLLQARGRSRDGLRVLNTAYLWLTEGAGTYDLIEAGPGQFRCCLLASELPSIIPAHMLGSTV